jgi:hypothetical protein
MRKGHVMKSIGMWGGLPTCGRLPIGLVGLLTIPSLFGAVEGVVINGTTGQPQSGVAVNLVHPSADQGMQTLGTATSDAAGAFKIDQPLPSPPALLQGTYEGAPYTLFLVPGTPTMGLRFVVYQAATKSPDVKLEQHMLMIEPTAEALHVTEVFQVSNAGKTTLLDPSKGSIQFYLPDGAQKATVNIEAPGGMPIQRPPEKTPQAGVFKASYPVKPGDATTYEVTYALPPAQKLSGKIFGEAPVTLVSGPSVTLTGDKLESRGQDPKLHAHIYQVPSSTAGASFEVAIEGTGAIRTDSADSGGGAPAEETGQPEPVAGPARVYDRLYWVLGLTFGLLAVGGTLLYRKGAA